MTQLKVTTAEPKTTTRPLVSIIIPTHNYGALISETLSVLQRQTHANWECIVVDDGSTDNTAEVLRRVAAHEPRVRCLRQANLRQAAARNLGLDDARGAYVQFLDADDLVEDHKLERQVAYLEGHPDVDIVYGGVRFFRTDSTDERLYSMGADNLPWMPQVSGEGRNVLRELVRDNIMVINSPLVRRELVEAVGAFDVNATPAEDWDYWLRCALAGARFRFADLDGSLALVRIHPMSSSQNRIRMQRAMLVIRKKLEDLLDDGELRALNRELAVGDAVTLGIEEASHGSTLRSAQSFVSAAWMAPRWRWRLKLLSCALAALLFSEQRLKGMISSSITRSRKNSG